MLKNKVKEIVKGLEAHRANPLNGLDCSLGAYMRLQFPDYVSKERNAQGVFLENPVEKLMVELEVNPNTMTVAQVLQVESARWIVPEIWREALRKGFRETPWYRDLIIREERVGQPKVFMPHFDYGPAEPKATAEGESVPEGSINYGHKDVSVGKHTLGVTVSDEARRYSTINTLTLYLEDAGARFGLKLQREFLQVLMQGDQADLSEAAATIGVAAAYSGGNNGLAYKDEVRVHIRAGRLGRQYLDCITTEDGANHLLNLPEHKDRQQGVPRAGLNLRTPVPQDANVYVAGGLTGRKFVWLDRRYGILQLTAVPLFIESERLIQTEAAFTKMSATTGFGLVQRDSRVIVDDELAFASNGWPSWMNPIY